MTIPAPWRFDRQLTDQVVNVVQVEESNPPAGEVPLQWILLTTLPIGSSDAVRQFVAWYCKRWGIETAPPEVPPTLHVMICWIAAMGGHVTRSTTLESDFLHPRQHIFAAHGRSGWYRRYLRAIDDLPGPFERCPGGLTTCPVFFENVSDAEGSGGAEGGLAGGFVFFTCFKIDNLTVHVDRTSVA